jgi:hypothetical protein
MWKQPEIEQVNSHFGTPIVYEASNPLEKWIFRTRKHSERLKMIERIFGDG